MKKIPACLMLAAMTLTTPLGAQIPDEIHYQGRLTDSLGDPVNGVVQFTVRIYDLPTGGKALYEELVGKVGVVDGVYSFSFGPEGTGTSAGVEVFSILDAAECWLALVVNGAEADTRTRILAVPYAMKARESEDAQALAAGLEVLQAEVNLARDFALIPAGTFLMGDAFSDGDADELPLHSVSVSAFYIGRTEVTKEKWEEVWAWGLDNGYTDLWVGGGKSPQRPVHNVTWFDAVKWLNAWSEKDGLTPVYTVGGDIMRTGRDAPDINYAADGYRLPTEAEWEKAARGGLEFRRFPWGNMINHAFANYAANGSAFTYDTSPYTTSTYHPAYNDGVSPYTSQVGDFTENGFGLHDMAGNLNEWCNDWYLETYYSTSPANDPPGPQSGSGRVFRGGSFDRNAQYCRSSARFEFPPGEFDRHIGFRPARTASP